MLIRITRKAAERKNCRGPTWFDQRLNEYCVQAIAREVVHELRTLKAAETSEAASYRHMALLRAILNKSVSDWEALDSAPKVPMHRPPSGEPRWLTRTEFARLERELPEYLQVTARFAVLTGLRTRAVLSLTWSRVDLVKTCTRVAASDMNVGQSLGLALTPNVLDVLKSLPRNGECLFHLTVKRST